MHLTVFSKRIWEKFLCSIKMLSTKDQVIVNACSLQLQVDETNSVSDEATTFILLQCHAVQWGININANLF